MSTRHHYTQSLRAARSYSLGVKTNRLLRTAKGPLLPKQQKKRAAVRKKMT